MLTRSTFTLSAVAMIATIFSAHAGEEPLAAGVTRVPVVFSGGHETLPVDHGRPVVLIAAALGVKPEIFRKAFSHVHPAGPDRGPTGEEARANKATLLATLSPYSITNDRLDAVSNFYRYPPGSSQLWKNKPATANALIKNGAVLRYELTSTGSGYTTPPTLTVPGISRATAKVQLTSSQDLETNGSIASITAITPPQEKP